MKNNKMLLLKGLATVFLGMTVLCQAQVGVPEIFPFTKENTALIKTVGGFNFDNDEYLDIVGIASLVDEKGKPVPRSTYIVHLEESVSKDFIVQWKYTVPEDLKADFSDIMVTDMDSDGLPEIVTVMNISDVGGSSWPDWLKIFEYTEGFPEIPTASMNRIGNFATRPRPLFIHCGDIDGNKVPDIVVSSGGPGRGVIIVSTKGQVSSENLEIIYHTKKPSTLQGMLSFRAITANLDNHPGDELVIFGGDKHLQVEVFIYEIQGAILKHTFWGISRREFDLAHLVSGDIDGDGLDEFIIPLKSGGAVLMTLQDDDLIGSRFLSGDDKIAALLIADLDANGLAEILFNHKSTTLVSRLEYDMSGALTDINSYRQSQYDNPLLKGFQYVDLAAIVSNSGRYTGSIIMPFLNKNYTKHGLCRWQLEETAPFIEKGPIDEVLGEIDLVLESKIAISESGQQVSLVGADDVIDELSGIVGEEVPLSPLPTTKSGMVSTKSINEVYRPDILVHPGEKVQRKITVNDLTLDDLKDLNVNVRIPDGVKFDPSLKEFTWFPADTQLGLHTIEAEFIWGAKRDVQSFTVYVNDKPEITTICPQRDIIQIGETFKINIDVEDSNDNAFLGYKLVSYPDGALIGANGELVWKPSFDQKDWCDFIIEISDGYDIDKISFSLFVNHPVYIESAANPLTTVGAKYHYRPVLKDKNDGFYVYWYDLSPRVTNWKRSGIYEIKIIDDVGRNNLERYIERYKREFILEVDPAKKIKKTHLINDVFVHDGKMILVFNVLGKRVPSSASVIEAFFQNLGMSIPRYSKPIRRYFYTFTLKEAPNGLSMDDIGVVDWIPDQNQFDYHSISYTVSDGYFTAEEHAQVYINTLPVIVSTADTNVYVNNLWQYEIKVTDLNTDSKLTYELIDAPDGMMVSPQGVISWTPTELQLNRHVFSFKVTDGMGKDVQKSSIFVNIKPKILSVPKPVALTNLKWEYRLDAEDPNGDPLVFKSVRLPKKAKFNPETGILSWSPKKSQCGVNDIVLEVVDSHGWSTLQEFQVHVFHNPGTQRLNFLRNTISLLALIGVIYWAVTQQ
ncbi:MAG: hypothetical protein KAT54_02020 [Candidatus Marinimicrobia bacterium]|nr:hypothetical protein [Candidatus Neomarinimicrobiota bacterium]